jgi:hypothetical protein
MNKINRQDLYWSVKRLPKKLKDLMQDPEWQPYIFVGGGYLRSIVAGEKINDIDIFVDSQTRAELLAHKLCDKKEDIYKTKNAYTIRDTIDLQIIHRWVFKKPEDVANSFDFTLCCAVIYGTEKTFDSYCDSRFYMDIASKRLVYRNPVRNEDAGGSMLRVLKYYQKGYRIPLDSLGNVISRLMDGVKEERMAEGMTRAQVITSLLVEVDPLIDPYHIAHLPSSNA